MDKRELIRRLMATFLGELEEHLRALERDVLHLEKADGEDKTRLLTSLLRTAHSLKGAASSVEVTLVEQACHRLESLLGGACEGLLRVDAELVQLLFTVVDALKDASERLRGNQDLQIGPISRLLPQLDAATHECDRSSIVARAARAPMVTVVAPAEPWASDGFVRVPAEKLDVLLGHCGELLVARRRWSARLDEIRALQDLLELTRADLQRLDKPLRELGRGRLLAFDRTKDNVKRIARSLDALTIRMAADQHGLEQAATPLDDDVKRVRMLPFGVACEGLERAVRDLARASDKDVDFVVEGSDVELDRSILESVKAPLLHLVRNAVAHGLESPDERRKIGKSAQGRIAVAAAVRGAAIEIVVADDGRGLDLDEIREQAHRRRMSVPDNDRELARLVLLPGFSTARPVTRLAGRGVGLDVVMHTVESLHGTVDFTFEPGHGTRFVLTLPLTLTTLRAVLVECGGQVFALPTPSVRRLVRVGASQLGAVEGHAMLLGTSEPIATASLATVLGLGSAEPRSTGGKVAFAVVATGPTQVAFAIDELLAEQDFVVKSLGPRLRHVRYFTGATMLPTGRLALILNPTELVHAALARTPGQSILPRLDAIMTAARRRLLVVDDSVTTRSLERCILEAAGYDVVVAGDGLEAWQQLQAKGADLVVADVEMPRMDGFALAQAIRGSSRFRSLPIVLVTALEREKDKARGLEVGADAYLAKSTFHHHQLLETIAQLL